MNLKQALKAVRKAKADMEKAKTQENAVALQIAERRFREIKKETFRAVS